MLKNLSSIIKDKQPLEGHSVGEDRRLEDPFIPLEEYLSFVCLWLTVMVGFVKCISVRSLFALWILIHAIHGFLFFQISISLPISIKRFVRFRFNLFEFPSIPWLF